MKRAGLLFPVTLAAGLSHVTYGRTAGLAALAAGVAGVLLARPRPAPAPDGWVYLVHAPQVPAWKIGWSEEPRERFEQLSAQARTRLRFVCCGPGSMAFEAELHRRYAHRWVQTGLPAPTEWFALTDWEAADVAAELKGRR